MGRKARFSPNIRHSTPQNRLQMLVVNVNNSQKMPVWDILRPYIDACANTLPSCCSRMHNLLDNTFHERFRPKKFSIPYSGNKNNTATKKQAAISSFISRIFISHCLAGISPFSRARVFALRRGRHLSPVKHWVTSSHVVPTKRN